MDLTVRPGGHIPREDRQQTPRGRSDRRDHGLEIVQITSNVTAPDEYGRTLFETAGKLGLRKITGVLPRAGVGRLGEQIEEVKLQLNQLVTLAEKHNVLPCVHIHSGSYLPSHGTLLYLLLRDFEPGRIGAYVDTLHMSLEGGAAGWQQGLDLLAPWMELCKVKNYLLTQKPRDRQGNSRAGKPPRLRRAFPHSRLPRHAPPAQHSGPFSLHSEYLPELSVEQCYAQTATDLEYFRSLL
ncbi:MAG: hypothetical protein R3C12_17900 [Planctomycetaceae bacterium]